MLLAFVQYGADVVYSEEQVDFKFVGVNRVVNGTSDHAPRRAINVPP